MATARKQGAGEIGRYASEDRLAAQENKDRTKVASEVALMKRGDKQWRAASTAGDQAAMDARVLQMIDESMGKVGGAPKGGPAPAPTQQAPVATKGPDLNTFMTAARKANPGVSDADLKAYYNSTYK
jgi:hypothetical protein